MNKFYQILCSLAVLLLLISSCKEEPIIIDEVKTMKDLDVPTGFNFDMIKPIELSIKLPATINYSSTNRLVEIWSEGVDGKPSKLIKTGSADNRGIYETTFSIPASTKKLFTNCFAGWRSLALQGAGLKLTDGVLTVDYNIGYGNTPPKPRQGLLGPPLDPVKSVRNLFKTGIENVLKNGDFSGDKYGKMDTWASPIEADGIWYATDEAKSYGSIISEEGNTFARIKSEKYSAGGYTQLIPATAGQVVTFAGDARGFDSQQDVYLFLVPRNQDGELLDVFSYNLVNPGIIWVNATVAGNMPEGTASCQILFYKGSTGIVDFDNALVRVNDPDSDRDGDRVLDWEDGYPDNADLAFDDFYPAKDKAGTFAFEDLWPQNGDFDFNDLVIDYKINRIANGRNKIVEIDFILQVRAISGNTENGFGMQIYLSPDLIAGVKADFDFPGDNIQLNENGTENGQKWATFIFFADAEDFIPSFADGSPTFNTTMGYHYVIPTEKKFRILLKEPQDPDRVSIDQINPFIFREKDRSHEIHLKGFPPTDLANTGLFGTSDDASNPGAGIYYQSKNGAPWALNVPVPFEYPVENAEILKGYNVLAKWITSGGNNYDDWYLDQQGYRNWENIYRW